VKNRKDDVKLPSLKEVLEEAEKAFLRFSEVHPDLTYEQARAEWEEAGG
jgi:hypothetical protein